MLWTQLSGSSIWTRTAHMFMSNKYGNVVIDSEELKEETHELEQVEQDEQEEIREMEDQE